MCLYSRRSWAAFVTVLLVQNQECRHLLHTWRTIEWIPLLFPGHLPVLGIVAVGSGLALIIFGISSFLIYRWVSHPADACFLRGQIPSLLLFILLLLYRFDWSNLYMCQCGIYTSVAKATAQRVMLKQQEKCRMSSYTGPKQSFFQLLPINDH